MVDPAYLELFAKTFLGALTFFVLITGLIGLIVPIFPGLTVMWLGTLVYAIIQYLSGHMTWISWLLFILITLLMLGGNVVDNIIIAKHVRDKNVPWSSILIAFAAGIILSLVLTPIVGMIASPLGLFLAEWFRLKQRDIAFANTKAWMTGWGWSFVARFGIGIVMILFWGLWAWL
jgi:uncharacterized protein YqgC (DUF456 family)